jgi:uncharacterized protein (TIGR02145 family)
MWDDYGNGWNGGLLQIFADGVEIFSGTIETGAGPETYEFVVDDGEVLVAIYTAGGWAYENSYAIADFYGNIVFEDGMEGEEPIGGNFGIAYCELPTCEWSVTLWDDYGDGWNGGLLEIYGGVNLLFSGTLETGAGPETFYFDVYEGILLTAVYTAGQWAYECSYIIYDLYGNLIFEDGMGGTEPTGGEIGIAYCDSHIPIIEYNPTSFTQSVTINGTAQDFLNIHCGGCGTLEWNIEVAYLEKSDNTKSLCKTHLLNKLKENWLTLDPLQGNLPPGNTEVVNVFFNAENLEEGIYYANIIIFSNDQSNPEVIIPVTMIVGEPLQHFAFEGGNPADPVWTINLANGKFNNIDLQPLDEIAVFDEDLMVGAFLLYEVLTLENALNNSLIAFSALNTQPGYQPGNPYRFKCWDASDENETEYFDIILLNPYGDAYTGDVFPAGENEYSIAEINFLSPIIQSYNLSEGYQFISSNLETIDPDMTEVLSVILNDNLDFVRNTQGHTLRKIGSVWVNGIGDWIIEEGYLIRMVNDDSFTMDGLFVDPETPISLTEGYQLVSYLPSVSVDALIAFQSIIGDNLDFIRNSQGYTLQKIGSNWINGIGNCISGEGYLVKMNTDDVLVFSIIPPCGEPITDPRDLQIYNTVKIGNQCWMADNMNLGEMIYGNEEMSNNGVFEKYCYDNDPANCEIYGGLYQWDEMMQYSTSTQGICPDDWHLPSDAEWFEMENYLDPSINNPNSTGWRGTDCGLKMLEGGSSGFEGLLSGYKDWDSEEFLMIGEGTYFRSTSMYVSPYSWYRAIENNNLQVYRNSATKTYGFSVRCLRDEITRQFSGQSSNQKNSKFLNYFVVKEGNPLEPVWTIYFEKGISNIGDEIAIYDGEILAGSGIVISDNILENAIPVFSNLYKAGNKPIIKVWNITENKEYILKDYTFSNPYGDAWTENVFPTEDGEYSLLHFSSTGISDENETTQIISIYPNPSEGIFNISIEGVSGKVQIKVFDIHGNDYRFFEIEGTKNITTKELDLKELAAGVYFISFSGEDFNQVKKIVIQ